MSQYFAQHGEDMWVAEHVPLPEQGVAIEVGAGDGVHLSNTFHFEQKGWRGFLVEPDPRNLARFDARRKWTCYPVACHHTEGESVFWQLPEPYHSGIIRCAGNLSTVKTVRLQTLLDAEGIDRIDVLSLDTEGNELEVWRSFDNRRIEPTVVIFEHWTQGMPDCSADIRREFADRYDLAHETECNYIFVRKGVVLK